MPTPFDNQQPTTAADRLKKSAGWGVTPTTSNPALPFLAQELDDRGEAFYGGGFTGWARKAVSNVFDPRFLTSNMSAQQKANYQMYIPKYENLINKKTLWDSWAGPVLGISAKNLAEVYSATKAETDLGDKAAQATGMVAREFSLNTLATVGGLFQAGEYAIRQTVAAARGLHELADTSNIKYNKNPYGNQFWNGTILEGFSNMMAQANVKTAFVDVYRLLAGNPDWEQADEIFKKNFQSSSAVYSMMWNPMLAAEFERRYKAGEDAYKIAYEIQNPWVEVTFGIALDPLSYLGVGIIGNFGKAKTGIKLAEHLPFGAKIAEKIPVFNKTLFSVPWETIYRTPELGDVIGLGRLVGKGKAEVDARMWSSVIPEYGDIIKSAKGKTAEEVQKLLSDSKAVLGEIASRNRKILDVENPYTLLSKRAQDRPYATAKKVQNFTNFLMKETSGNVDEAMSILNDLVKLNHGSEDEMVVALMNLSNRKFANALLSPMAMQTAELTNKLYDNGKILDVLSSTKEDRQVTLFKLLDDVLQEMNPSVEEMRVAKKFIDSAEGKAELLKAGDNAALAKKQKLAAMYDRVPKHVKAVSRVTRPFEKHLYNPMMKMQGVLFFNLNAAYPVRNFFGNAAPMAIDLGLETAILSTAESLSSFSGKKVVGAIVESLNRQVDDILGIIPSKMDVAFSKTGASQLGSGAWGGAGVSAGGEQIASARIALKTIQNDADLLIKGMMPELKPFLDSIAQAGGQDTANLLVKLLRDNHGNLKKTIPEFMKATQTGYIESWRFQTPEKNLLSLLKDNGATDEFYDILKTSKTPEEMMVRKNELLGKFKKKGDLSYLEPPVAKLEPDLEQAFEDVPSELQEDLFKGSKAAWNQAAVFQRQFEDAFIAELGVLQGQGTITREAKEAFLQNFRAIDQGFPEIPKSIERLNMSIREGIAKDVWKEGANLQEIWNRKISMLSPVIDKTTGMAKVENGQIIMESEVFSLAEIYPNQNLALLTPRTIVDKAWNAYYPVRSQKWTMQRAGLFDAKLAAMRANPWVNIDTLAAGMGQGQNRVNVLEQIYKYRNQAIEYSRQSETARMVGEAGNISSALAQYGMRLGIPTSTEQGAKLEAPILKIINDNLPKKNTDAVAKELSAIESRMWEKGVPPEEIATLKARQIEISASVAYEHLDEVPLEEGMKAMDKWAYESGKARVWPYNPGSEAEMAQSPTQVRALYESREYYESALNSVFKKAADEWGQISTVDGPITSGMINNFSKAFTEKWEPNVLYMAEHANAMRDFILHSYEKTYLDVATAYIFPYQYWQTRTYSKFMQRVVQDPRLLTNYIRYKNTLAKLHAGMPDWWKQNIPITGLPGQDPDEPLFFNLEATINPMNGLTGTDFSDPYKRVNWWTQVVDDGNKFGPSMMMPINWAVALALWKQGEKDASARWAGRLFPQSQAIKSGLTLLGVKPTALTPHNEVDPIVNIMSGGLDPYEQRRVHRALATMVASGQITEEQSYDAAYYKNETWDEAVNMAVKGRAPANLASFFLGVGFKPRTQNDMLIDQFYEEYGRVRNTKDATSPEAYKNELSALRQKYPFMDTLLISKNFGEERETAYAYGILSRIPPGQSDDLLKMVGIRQDSIDKFYDSKGDLTKMSIPERELFMAAIMNMGAILQIPDNATSVDWNRAKTAYSQIYADAEAIYGKDIWQKVDTYYGMLDSNHQAGNDYLDANQDVQDVLTWKQQAIATNPDVYKYYGSIDTIQRYYDTKLREALVAQFGEEIYAQFDEYGLLKLTDPKAASRYYKAHPALKQYGKVKREYQDKINRTIVQFAQNLPERPNVLLREDVSPQAPAIQGDMGQTLNPPQKTWQDWQAELSPPMQRLIVSYFTQGENLDYNVQEQLDYLAEKQGISGDELLQQIGNSLYQASGQPLASNP